MELAACRGRSRNRRQTGSTPIRIEGRMRHTAAVLAIVLAACGSAGEPAGPIGDPPPGGNPPGPAPAGPLPMIGGCQIFPADHAWNRDVSGDPVHPNSAALLAQMVPETPIHLDLGTTEEYYGIPYRVRRAYTAPASHCGQYSDDALPPYGTRVRLKASFPLDDYSGDALVILTAMKRYGLMLADQGSAWYVTGTSDPRWEDALDQLRVAGVRGRDFEVVASGPVTAC
jgi:hypothetical protein